MWPRMVYNQTYKVLTYKGRKEKNTRCGFLFLGTYDLPTVL